MSLSKMSGEKLGTWLMRGVAAMEAELAAKDAQLEAMQAEIDRLREKCDKQAKMLQHLFPDRQDGVFFICGEGGERDTNGLPERIHVCPAYGCGWSEIYSRASLDRQGK